MTNPKQEPNLSGELSDEQLTGVTGGTANPDVTILPSPTTPVFVPTPYPIQGTGPKEPTTPKVPVVHQ